jgi:hypothetical protein
MLLRWLLLILVWVVSRLPRMRARRRPPCRLLPWGRSCLVRCALPVWQRLGWHNATLLLRYRDAVVHEDLPQAALERGQRAHHHEEPAADRAAADERNELKRDVRLGRVSCKAHRMQRVSA